MLLAQKPPAAHRFTVHHRRMPSAPAAAIVQPTKTPGLLTISKPAVQQKRATPRQQRNAPPAQQDRGRQKQTISKVATPSRSTSRSSSTRGKRNARQPSPPITTTSQAEGAPLLSDPFLDDSVTKQPSKNHKRREPSPFKTSNSKRHSTPSLPLAVPNTDKATKRKTMPAFPVCDDVSELGDTPVTPTKSKRPADKRSKSGSMLNISIGTGVPFPSLDDGPRTAPLSSVSNTASSFFGPSTPTPRGKKGKFQSQTPPRPTRERRHKRVPSEGVFHMSSSSSDEEFSEQDRTDIRSLFERLRYGESPKDGLTAPMSESAPAAAQLTAAELHKLTKFRKFAGSGFQSSPSPDELPDPTAV